MTTIAYRAGIMASDTRCEDAELQQKYFRPKIRVLKDAVIAESGEDADIDRFIGWWQEGRPSPPPRIKKGNIGMIVVYPDLRVEVWTDCRYGMPITEEYCASGSGAGTALGVMWYGGSAVDAVKGAMDHDPGTGGDVRFVDVRKAFSKRKKKNG